MIRLLLLILAGLGLCSAPLIASECRDDVVKVGRPTVDLSWKQNDGLRFVVKGGDTPLKRAVGTVFTGMAGPFWLTEMSQVIRKVADDPRDLSVPEKMLSALDVTYTTRGLDPRSIPVEGGLLIVANHPRFGVEGLSIAAALLRVRPDVKIVMNQMNEIVPGFEEVSFGMDMTGNPKANVRTRQEIEQWLVDGHAVLIFPAGAVSAYPADGSPSVDKPWGRSPLYLTRRSGAQVLPIYSDDTQPGWSHRMATRFLPPQAAKSTLPQEILRQQHSTVDLAIGRLISAETLSSFPDNESALVFLREQVYQLR